MMDLLIAIILRSIQRRTFVQNQKGAQLSPFFRTWKWVKLCINALVVLKITTSGQMSVNLINGLHSFSQVRVLISLCNACPHYVTCWGRCCCCLTAMGLQISFSCLTQTHRPGCTCGQVNMVVTMVSIIRAPGWCNDKGGAWLSLISSSISIYYPHRHEHHRTVTITAGCNLAIRRAFPAAALPHAQRSSTYPAVFLFLCCLSLHCNLWTPASAFQVNRDILCLSKFL